jgi:hypothetical protein
MKITSHLLEAYLKCPTKCWLRSTGEQTTDRGYSQYDQAREESYRTAEIDLMLSRTHQSEFMRSPHGDSLKAGKWRLATDVPVQTTRLESLLHAVESFPSEGRGKPAQLIPLRFVPTNKLGRDTKLLLGFDALVLAEILGREVSIGKIVYGDTHKRC